MVAGQDLAPQEVSGRLRDRFKLLGVQGLTGMALAGIDMALWDAAARAADLPLHRLLGATARPVPAYGGVGFDGVEGSARAAEQWARRGFRAVKAKIGYPTLEEDLAVVRAMRSAVGPGVQLMVDYNQSLSPVEASRRLRALDDEGLAWLCATRTAHWLEYADWWNAILQEPLDVRDGMAHACTRAGSGVAFNEEAVQRYLA
jgi:mandelate racemase